jgi:hypothetical protein
MTLTRIGSNGGTPLTDPAPSRGPWADQPIVRHRWPSETVSSQTWYETCESDGSAHQVISALSTVVEDGDATLSVGVSGAWIGCPRARTFDADLTAVLCCAVPLVREDRRKFEMSSLE